MNILNSKPVKTLLLSLFLIAVASLFSGYLSQSLIYWDLRIWNWTTDQRSVLIITTSIFFYIYITLYESILRGVRDSLQNEHDSQINSENNQPS